MISVAMFFGSLASVCTGIRFFKMSTIAGTAVIPVTEKPGEEGDHLNKDGD
jgi:hypothetical protein